MSAPDYDALVRDLSATAAGRRPPCTITPALTPCTMPQRRAIRTAIGGSEHRPSQLVEMLAGYGIVVTSAAITEHRRRGCSTCGIAGRQRQP